MYRKPASAHLRNTHPLAQGLLGAWFFTEGAGTNCYDSSPYNNPTTANLSNTTAWSTPPGPNDGNAISIASDAVSLPATGALLLKNSPFSFVTLVNARSFGGGSKGRIIDNLSAGLNGWDIYIDNANVTNGYSVQLDSQAARTNSSAAVLNTWQHVAFTVDLGANYRFYVNGVDAGSGNAGGIVVNGSTWGPVNTMLIGDWAGTPGTRTFDGWIDHALVYNRTLSQNEVTQLYYDPYQMIRPRSQFFKQAPPAFANPIVNAQIYRPSRTSIIAY